MRKILSLSLFLATAFAAQAQLVSSLNFSTGYDNVTTTTIPVGNQDPNWKVTALTAPFSPAGIIPYDSYTQTPWNLGFGSPVTPAGTEWISYDAIGMTMAAPPDFSGTGTMTLEYRFDMCRTDDIRFAATMRSDNRISDVRVDGVSTGFSQTLTSANWSTGSALGYSTTLGPGTHTVEVDIINAASGNQTNPSGLNVDGTISSVTGTNSIVDRDNFPNYICCNANFTYCFNTTNPFWVDFSGDPSEPGTFDWFVNGAHVGSGLNFPYTFPAPGNYHVCLRHLNTESGVECEKCIHICIADNPADGSHRKAAPGNGLGVRAADKAFEVAQVYPNPAHSEVNIDLTSAAGASVSVQLYDAMGKLAKEINATVVKGQKKLTIATNNLPAGVYSLNISDGKNLVSEKIQIEK